MKVRDLMNPTTHTCSIDATLHDAARIMWEHDTGFLPVVDQEGNVAGVITDRDICMAAYTRGIPLHADKVSSAMCRTIWSVEPNESLRGVEDVMRRHQIRRVPVLDKVTGQLVGVITLSDIARHAERSTIRKALGAGAVAKTLAAIVEPRPVRSAAE